MTNEFFERACYSRLKMIDSQKEKCKTWDILTDPEQKQISQYLLENRLACSDVTGAELMKGGKSCLRRGWVTTDAYKNKTLKKIVDWIFKALGLAGAVMGAIATLFA